MNKKIMLAVPIGICAVLLLLPYLIYADDFVMYQNSESMYPAILPGDLLIIEQSGIEKVQKGDIIAFYTHAEGIEVMVRRTITISADNDGNLGIDTQGDHEEFHDIWTIYSKDYIGRVVEINPSAKFLLSEYFRYPMVAIIVVSAALLIRESIPKKGLEVEELFCYRCKYRWFPRIIDGEVKIPSTCPNKDCRSPYWQTPRKTD